VSWIQVNARLGRNKLMRKSADSLSHKYEFSFKKTKIANGKRSNNKEGFQKIVKLYRFDIQIILWIGRGNVNIEE